MSKIKIPSYIVVEGEEFPIISEYEYQIGEIITFNSREIPAKCTHIIKHTDKIQYHFIQGKFVPLFPGEMVTKINEIK